MLSVDGHTHRKLDSLYMAGAIGIPVNQWRQSTVVVPEMLRQGLMKETSRVEVVKYYVITDKGQDLAEAIGPC